MRSHIATLFALVIVFGVTTPIAQAQDKPHPIVAEVKAHIKDASKPFTMIVTLEIKKGSEKQFETAFAKAVRGTRKEKGNINYDLNRDSKNGSKYLVYERWRNLDALRAHMKTKHITTLLVDIGDLLTGPPEVRVLLPVGR